MTARAGTTPPRTRDAAATRAALLQAAMRRFTVLGFERTTTRDVAADAGVNVSLIARYFGSKEGLLSAVVAQSADALGSAGRGLDGDLVDSLVEGLRPGAWQEFGGEHPLLMLLRDDGEGAAVQRLRRQSIDTAIAVLTDKITADGGDPGAAEAVLAVLVGVLTLRANRPDGVLATADETRLRALLERLVRATGASADPLT